MDNSLYGQLMVEVSEVESGIYHIGIGKELSFDDLLGAEKTILEYEPPADFVVIYTFEGLPAMRYEGMSAIGTYREQREIVYPHAILVGLPLAIRILYRAIGRRFNLADKTYFAEDYEGALEMAKRIRTA